MREILTSGSVGGLVEQSPSLPGQATALVHEAYIRLVGSDDPHWDSRGHFFTAAAEAMRRILVENARRKQRDRHGGGRIRLDLQETHLAVNPPSEMHLALDEAISKLAAEDHELGELVKLRFFAGLTMEQAARVLGVSLRTAERHWTYARAWLHSEICRQDARHL